MFRFKVGRSQKTNCLLFAHSLSSGTGEWPMGSFRGGWEAVRVINRQKQLLFCCSHSSNDIAYWKVISRFTLAMASHLSLAYMWHSWTSLDRCQYFFLIQNLVPLLGRDGEQLTCWQAHLVFSLLFSSHLLRNHETTISGSHSMLTFIFSLHSVLSCERLSLSTI